MSIHSFFFCILVFFIFHWDFKVSLICSALPVSSAFRLRFIGEFSVPLPLSPYLTLFAALHKFPKRRSRSIWRTWSSSSALPKMYVSEWPFIKKGQEPFWYLLSTTVPHICKKNYTAAIWSLEILHLKVRKYKVCHPPPLCCNLTQYTRQLPEQKVFMTW